jgi:hypothetical protein
MWVVNILCIRIDDDDDDDDDNNNNNIKMNVKETG